MLFRLVQGKVLFEFLSLIWMLLIFAPAWNFFSDFRDFFFAFLPPSSNCFECLIFHRWKLSSIVLKSLWLISQRKKKSLQLTSIRMTANIMHLTCCCPYIKFAKDLLEKLSQVSLIFHFLLAFSESRGE